ncbi:uncharacterized protein LOC134699258 [Mytilus trossulus]|uniref:uncharacterized protein LOC134699258 n=1 Tax=Mytilus trossulus TaxID=6551 RepID=UPI0030068598
MSGTSRKQENCDVQNFFGMKKVTDWEIYGVKRFPYRGQRNYTPCLYQSFDGGMVISNDVFGLTIRQFERIYKACLDRRKKHKQWILNLRYPDKSSNEYLEYLQDGTECDKDHLVWLENVPREKYLYEHLVKVVGNEIDIRNRQRLFIIQDMICSDNYHTQISSGSLAEGMDLYGSDIDIMWVIRDLDVVLNDRNIKHRIQRTIVMETDIDHPGFTYIRLVQNTDGEIFRGQCPNCPPGTCDDNWYLSVNSFLANIMKCYRHLPIVLHGPCLSDRENTADYAYCLRSKSLPHNAIPWAFRHRRQWPPNKLIDRIINYGCLLVPIGPKTITDNDLLWRISFSMAEKILVHSFNFTQFLSYGLLKLTLKRIINTNIDVNELLCSYFLKTVLFWVSEEVGCDTFQLPNLYYCFSLCLDKLISWVNICYCPNYFIPEHNMFSGKINLRNNKILLCVLGRIKSGGMDGLIKNLFPPDNENHYVLDTKSESSTVMLFRRTIKTMSVPRDISSCYKGLAIMQSLKKYESSAFIIAACKYYYAYISQHVVQRLPPSNTVVEMYNTRKCYQRHLRDGIRTDSMSGWLLYASFYYVTRQFNVTLKLTDYILSRCSPALTFTGKFQDCKLHKNNYRQNIHSSMTMNDKMKIATVNSVMYLQHSPLIPEELQMDVEEHGILVPPVVMCHCIRFLCYHHLGDILNRQQALRNLYLTVTTKYFIQQQEESDSLTILGICYEISGDTATACKCYDKALRYDGYISNTAEKRKSKLDGNLYN